MVAGVNMELDDSGHICPISREAGLPPRRSIDINQHVGFDVHLKQQQHSSRPVSSTVRPASAVGPDQATVWHPSLQWSASPGCSSPSHAGHTVHEQHRTQQLQQLAMACCNRNVKQLQALLAQELPCISDAADTTGNTALHMVLLPYSGPQEAAAAASGGTDLVSAKSIGTGSLSWLTGCFGGAPAGGISRAGSMRSLSGTAALQAQQQMVSALIAAGAAANARNLQGLTPLMVAVQQVLDVCSTSNSLIAPALRVLEQLCKHVLLDPNVKDNQGRTALVRLLQGRQQAAAISSVHVKQQQVVHDSVRSTHGQFSRASKSAHPAGAAAGAAPAAAVSSAAFGMVQLKAAQILLHCGADCNAADSAGMTPLMFAAAQPTVTKDLLQLLLERGANPRQLDNSRRSALTHALLAHNLPLLPAVGAGGSGQRQCAACGSCGGTGAAAVDADMLQAAQAHAQQQPSADSPEAAAAVGAGSPIGLKPDAAALNACADAMTASAVSCSAASSACDSCASPDMHAQVHTCSMYSGITAASHSSGTAVRPNPQHSMVVRALCSYGALDLHPASINTRFPGLNNFTQLHIAMRRGDVVALQMLLAGGADVNATDTWGNSPLMYWPVAPAEPAELVEELVGKLLSHGADPNIPNHDGWHALDLACDLNKLGKVVVKPGHVPVHALLVGWGAKNSHAFKDQYRNPPQLLCMRTDSANDFIRNSKGFGSIRAISLQELESQVAAIREDTSA